MEEPCQLRRVSPAFALLLLCFRAGMFHGLGSEAAQFMCPVALPAFCTQQGNHLHERPSRPPKRRRERSNLKRRRFGSSSHLFVSASFSLTFCFIASTLSPSCILCLNFPPCRASHTLPHISSDCTITNHTRRCCRFPIRIRRTRAKAIPNRPPLKH